MVFNSCKNNSLLISSIDKIKESQKTAIDSLQIHEFENINASLRKKEFDYLKSSEFESSIHDDLLNDKKISKENLIKVKEPICTIFYRVRPNQVQVKLLKPVNHQANPKHRKIRDSIREL